ncbi:hypothetical protein PtA15_9A258 [Puccinia triticina]|uniref:Uncharacterized protein n=1 Tax=Puccinia triticina TaxID=208348 RepID=A0ABY7CS91_9BASI|nr:uncharacterized protein PtA15_9A258 [Puccinia triticina]WAQ88133.1 hypothetical protein PtA15_9A258 [Puccinia triticina]
MKYLQALINAILVSSLALRLTAEDAESLQRLSTEVQSLDMTPATSIMSIVQQGTHISRRGVALAGHYPYPRQVTCTNAEGQQETYKSKDCLSAAKQISSYHIREVTCSTCKMSLVRNNGDLLLSTAPADRLRQMTVAILKACALNKSSNAAYSEEDSHDSNIAPFTLLISQGNGTKCQSRK